MICHVTSNYGRFSVFTGSTCIPDSVELKKNVKIKKKKTENPKIPKTTINFERTLKPTVFNKDSTYFIIFDKYYLYSK